MFVVYTQSPQYPVEWTPPPDYSWIKHRGNTVSDKWFWTTQTLDKAVFLKQEIQRDNRGKGIRLYIKQMTRLPNGWA